MTTVEPPTAPALTDAASVEESPLQVLSVEVIPDAITEARSGERLRRLEQRRRLVREQLLAVLVLFVALAVTVAVLAMQWLDSTGGLH
jgi:hypothetical protein